MSEIKLDCFFELSKEQKEAICVIKNALIGFTVSDAEEVLEDIQKYIKHNSIIRNNP